MGHPNTPHGLTPSLPSFQQFTTPVETLLTNLPLTYVLRRISACKWTTSESTKVFSARWFVNGSFLARIRTNYNNLAAIEHFWHYYPFWIVNNVYIYWVNSFSTPVHYFFMLWVKIIWLVHLNLFCLRSFFWLLLSKSKCQLGYLNNIFN